ncbi:MAG: glycosyltransferase family protein [Magnetococcales bacterium]|nr:glycosyltransferase family protein [Magnetococcales bacterium]
MEKRNSHNGLNSDPIINLVAVRMKSSRLPGKAMRKIMDKSVIELLMERVTKANIPFKTVICTSTIEQDDVLAKLALSKGFELFRGHPDNVLDRFIKAANKYGAKHIVRITGDNPLTDPLLIDQMCELHLQNKADYTFTQSTPRGTRPEIMSLSAMQNCLLWAQNPDHSEYMSLYFKNYPDIFKNVEFVDPNPDRIRPEYRLTIDTPDDLAIIQQVYNKFYPQNPGFLLDEVIEYLDQHPEIPHSSRFIASAGSDKINTKLTYAG